MKTQKGFVFIDTMLSILIVLVVAIGIYGVWHNEKNKNKAPVNQTVQTNVSNSDQKSSKASGSTSRVTKKYLKISEWGVQIPYTSSDTLGYSISSDDPNTATITSQYLSDNFSNCRDLNFGAGKIIRYSGSDIFDPGPDTVAQAYAQNPSMFNHLGQYYYWFGNDQDACSTGSSDPNGTASNTANDFTKSLIPKIEAIPFR